MTERPSGATWLYHWYTRAVSVPGIFIDASHCLSAVGSVAYSFQYSGGKVLPPSNVAAFCRPARFTMSDHTTASDLPPFAGGRNAIVASPDPAPGLGRWRNGAPRRRS